MCVSRSLVESARAQLESCVHAAHTSELDAPAHAHGHNRSLSLWLRPAIPSVDIVFASVNRHGLKVFAGARESSRTVDRGSRFRIQDKGLGEGAPCKVRQSR